MNSEAHSLGRAAHPDGLIMVNGDGIVQNERKLRPIQPELDGARRLQDRIFGLDTIYIDTVGAIQVKDLVSIPIRVDLKVIERNSGIIFNENVILWAAANARYGGANWISSPRQAA